MNKPIDYKVVETMEKYDNSFVDYWEQYKKMSGFDSCKKCNCMKLIKIAKIRTQEVGS